MFINFFTLYVYKSKRDPQEEYHTFEITKHYNKKSFMTKLVLKMCYYFYIYHDKIIRIEILYNL